MSTGPGSAGASRHALLGILFMIGSAIAFPLMNAVVKYLGIRYPAAEVVFARNLGHLCFVAIVFGPRFGTKLFVTRAPKLQMLNGALLLTSTIFFFTAVSTMPLAEATAITFMAPILVAVLAGPLLGERVGLPRWLAIAGGFAGMLVIVRPGAGVLDLGAALCFGSALCYALYQIVTRRIAAHDAAAVTTAYSGLVATVISVFAVPFFWRTPESLVHLLLFASLGVFGGIGHYCVAKAFTYAHVSVVAPFHYVQLIGASALGFLWFGDLPDLYAWAGSALIVASGIGLALHESRAVRSARRTETEGP